MFRDQWVFRTDSTQDTEPGMRHRSYQIHRVQEYAFAERYRRCSMQLMVSALAALVIISSSHCDAQDVAGIQPSTLRPVLGQRPTQQSDYPAIRMTPVSGGDRLWSPACGVGDQFSDVRSRFHNFNPFRKLKERWRTQTRPRWQKQFLGYPEEFCEPPLGLFLTAHTDAMITSGIQSNMTLFQCDFLTNSDRLNSSGFRKLNRIADMLSPETATIVVEETPQQPELAEYRRATVSTWFANNGYVMSSEQIVVSPLIPGGLNSRDIDAIRSRFDSSTSAGAISR